MSRTTEKREFLLLQQHSVGKIRPIHHIPRSETGLSQVTTPLRLCLTGAETLV